MTTTPMQQRKGVVGWGAWLSGECCGLRAMSFGPLATGYGLRATGSDCLLPVLPKRNMPHKNTSPVVIDD